jgi:hypothetical protein
MVPPSTIREKRDMDNLHQASPTEWQWKDVPDKQRWVVAWGVLWRIWVLSLGAYMAVLVVVLIIALAIAVLSS